MTSLEATRHREKLRFAAGWNRSGRSPGSMLAVAAFLLAACILLQPIPAHARLKVATTFTVIADMANNVAGDAADVVSITKPGADIHNYQPTPRDILATQDAGLVLWNGLNLELWFQRFFANLRNVPSAVISEGIEPIGIGEGPYAGKPNPHAWMSPDLALLYVDNIARAMASVDPENRPVYEANATAYKKQIRLAVEPLRQTLSVIPAERRWLLTSEGAFSYLARDMGLNEAYVWPINADQQGTPHQVRKVIDKVREHNIPAVFSESTIPADTARQIAAETGIKYGGVLYVDSLTSADGPAPTYLDLLRVTTETIARALKP